MSSRMEPREPLSRGTSAARIDAQRIFVGPRGGLSSEADVEAQGYLR